MKGKAIIPLVLGLCIGLVAVKFLVSAVQDAKGSTADAKTISVVRAIQDIDGYQLITEEYVELVETTDDALAPAQERISSLEDVLGRVTAKAIPERSPVLQSMLAPPDTPAGMVGRIPVGFRAVSVKIDEVTGVAYQLKPGSWVDVIVVMDVITGTGRGSKETIAKVILQHVKVAAIGRLTSGPADGRGSKMKPAKSVTLLVLERDVPKLHLAATRGKVTLAMRGDDENTTDLPGIARESEVFNVFGDKKTPESNAQVAVATTRPKRAPFTQPVRNEPHRVVVYHGTPGGPSTVEQIIFENVRSRNVVELGRGPVNRDGRSLLDDDRDGRESRDAGARRNRRHLGGIPDFSNLEAE